METQQGFSLNNNDILILEIIKKNPSGGIMQLQKGISISYKNTKQHLDKLESYNLIKIIRAGRGKQAIVDLTPLAKKVLELSILMNNPNLKTEDIKKILKDKNH